MTVGKQKRCLEGERNSREEENRRMRMRCRGQESSWYNVSFSKPSCAFISVGRSDSTTGSLIKSEFPLERQRMSQRQWTTFKTLWFIPSSDNNHQVNVLEVAPGTFPKYPSLSTMIEIGQLAILGSNAASAVLGFCLFGGARSCR